MRKINLMKNNLLRLVVLSAVCLMMLAGCENGSKVTDIYITKADMPQVKYIEGQELDLSDGKLTVVADGEESKLPLASPDVTVSGYDNTRIGEQTLTVEYGGLSTTVTVTVEARMTVENYETMYFVGDVFNNQMGKVRVITDDLKQITVNMNDEAVSLVSFDSTKAGQTTVTIRYSNGSESYDCTFSIIVYDKSTVEFTPPTKTLYSSDDTGVDTDGGYLTVTSADGKLTKRVPLSADMIAGFDLSAATIENVETPKLQTVTVEYLGKQFQYDIQILFGRVSLINYHVTNTLYGIDWTDAKENGLSEEVSTIALETVREFFELSDLQLETLSTETKELVVRAGAIGASTAFQKELKKYEQTFVMDGAGSLYLNNPGYEQAKADLIALNDPKATLHVYAALLRNIVTEYGDTRMDEEMVVGNLIAVYNKEAEENMLWILDHLIYVHELVSVVPTEWTRESLKDYGSDLMAAVMEIYNAGYYTNGLSDFYRNVFSTWREKGDMYDILYSYFLYEYEGGKEFMKNYMFGSMPMPGLLEDWYICLNSAVGYANQFGTLDPSETFLADTTACMFYFYQAQEIAEHIKNSGNQLWIDVYWAYDVEYMMDYYMYALRGGYLSLTGGLVDSDAYNQLWHSYYEVLKLAIADTLSAEENKEELTAMFRAFAQLNPSELLGFLSTMNYNYVNSMGNVLVLSYDEETAFNQFMVIVRDYYLTYLDEENQPLFANLLQAMENYALIGYKDGAEEAFRQLMKQLSEDYAALSADAQANFDQYAGISYAKYLAIYRLSAGQTSVTLSAQEQALFAEFEQVLRRYFTVYVTISELVQSEQTPTMDLYGVFYALHSRATELYETILLTASEEAVNALFVINYEFMETQITLAKTYFLADNICVSSMVGNVVPVTEEDGTQSYVPMWLAYMEYGMMDILANMSEMVYHVYAGEEGALDREYLLSLMQELRALTVVQKRLLTVLGADVAYYRSLGEYLGTVVSQAASDGNVVQNLLDVEVAYINYTINGYSEEAQANFCTLMEQARESYGVCTQADRQYLDDMYQYYLDCYEQLKANTED